MSMYETIFVSYCDTRWWFHVYSSDKEQQETNKSKSIENNTNINKFIVYVHIRARLIEIHDFHHHLLLLFFFFFSHINDVENEMSIEWKQKKIYWKLEKKWNDMIDISVKLIFIHIVIRKSKVLFYVCRRVTTSD